MRINLQQQHRGRAAAAEYLELTGWVGNARGPQQGKRLYCTGRVTGARTTATTAGARGTTKAGATTTTRPSTDREGGRNDGG